MPIDRSCGHLNSLALLILCLTGCGGGGGGNGGDSGDQPSPPSSLEQTIAIQGQGQVFSSRSAAEDCARDQQPCAITVGDNYRVSYQASAADGWRFNEWQNCEPDGAQEQMRCRYQLSRADVDDYEGETLPTLTAVFTELALAHSLEIVGQGNILAGTAQRNCLLEDQPCTVLSRDDYGETYRASAAEGWRFVGWRDCAPAGTDAENSCTYSVPLAEFSEYPDYSLPPLVAIFEEFPLIVEERFFDDFSIASLDYYTVSSNPATNPGTANWDQASQSLALTTGDNASITLSSWVPASSSGHFSVDLVAGANHNGLSIISIKLLADELNYYELRNADAGSERRLTKVVDGEVVESSSVNAAYGAGTRHALDIAYSPTEAMAGGYGTITTLSGDDTVIEVQQLRVEATQQDITIDNLFHNTVVPEYLIAVGDSITLGEQDNDDSDGIGYPPVLKDVYYNTTGTLIAVLNEGVSGHRAGQGNNIFNNILNRHPAATGVLLFYGTNDSRREFSVPSGFGINPGEAGYAGSYKDSLQKMINKATRRNLSIYLAKTLKTSDNTTWNNALQAEYGAVVDELIERNAMNYTPPDFYCYFNANPAQLPDARHPNNNGYRAIAQLWRNTLLNSGGACLP